MANGAGHRLFITEETPQDFEKRFRARYGFDLAEVESGLLADILARIAAERRAAGPPN